MSIYEKPSTMSVIFINRDDKYWKLSIEEREAKLKKLIPQVLKKIRRMPSLVPSYRDGKHNINFNEILSFIERQLSY